MRLSGVRYLCKGNGKCVIVIVAAAGLARFSAPARLVARSPSQAPREQASEQLLQQNPSRLSSMDEEEEESKGQPAERPVATAMYMVPSAVRFASVRQFAKEQVDRERKLIVHMTKERNKHAQSSSSLQVISIRLDLN